MSFHSDEGVTPHDWDASLVSEKALLQTETLKCLRAA